MKLKVEKHLKGEFELVFLYEMKNFLQNLFSKMFSNENFLSKENM